MIHAVLTEGDLAAGEQDLLIGGLRSETGETTKGVVMCHGSGSTGVSFNYDMRFFIQPLAAQAMIHTGDYGFQTWGSDVVVDRIGAAIAVLRDHGVTGKVALIGVSMGGCSVLNYAMRHPEDVSCVAAMIPLVDLNDVRANPWLTARWPEIDAIYGAPPANDYTGHNPVDFAGDLDPAMPIRIWTSTDDGLARPPTHDAFMAARPQTWRTSMGPVGHSVPNKWASSVLGFIARNHLLP